MEKLKATDERSLRGMCQVQKRRINGLPNVAKYTRKRLLHRRRTERNVVREQKKFRKKKSSTKCSSKLPGCSRSSRKTAFISWGGTDCPVPFR
ncbi:hypothetical protein GQ55_5G499800 [Panicum hallii var. hallii]|uniref:Uncharacterized protein n=1 Tax=Panicum hallii var. hallii TaxID=1504633 RepID=A0A2T7DRW0_9POAL|nr:hypothetical protein GQ55_5G499800 [Panicum hallii var. hallii]